MCPLVCSPCDKNINPHKNQCQKICNLPKKPISSSTDLDIIGKGCKILKGTLFIGQTTEAKHSFYSKLKSVFEYVEKLDCLVLTQTKLKAIDFLPNLKHITGSCLFEEEKKNEEEIINFKPIRPKDSIIRIQSNRLLDDLFVNSDGTPNKNIKIGGPDEHGKNALNYDFNIQSIDGDNKIYLISDLIYITYNDKLCPKKILDLLKRAVSNTTKWYADHLQIICTKTGILEMKQNPDEYGLSDQNWCKGWKQEMVDAKNNKTELCQLPCVLGEPLNIQVGHITSLVAGNWITGNGRETHCENISDKVDWGHMPCGYNAIIEEDGINEPQTSHSAL